MHITKVELQDIKSHVRFTQEFHRGTTAITGANGAGKTTVIEAIAWTLFDLLDYKKDDFTRRGAKHGTARVTFQSHLDERRYTVIRDTKTKYQVFDNELKTVIADKKAEVARFLQQHLGVEPGTDLETLFRSAIGVPQGTLTADFLRTPAERKPKFDKLLKVEEYREGAEKLLETKRFVENRLQTVREKIKFAEGELARLEGLEIEHDETSAKIIEFETILSEVRGVIETKTQIVAVLDAAEKLVNETRTQRDKLEFRFDAAKQSQARIEIECGTAARAAELQKTLANDYNAHCAALAELKILDAKQIERNAIQAEARKTENLLIETKAEAKRLAENLRKAIDAGRQATELQPQIETQKKLETESDALERQKIAAEEAARQAADLGAELNSRINQHRDTKAQIADAERGADAAQKIKRLDETRRALEAELKRAVEAEASLRVLEPQRQELRAEIEKLKIAVGRGEQATNGFEDVSRLALEAENLNQKESSLVSELARLQAKIQHDEKFRGEVQNGLCPILSQKCLNIGENETLETYFHHELSGSYARLENLTAEQKTIGANLSAARAAERKLTQLESLRLQLEQTRRDLSERETNLRGVENKIVSFDNFKPASLHDLKRRRDEIEREIADLNVAAGKYVGLQSLRQSLAEIEREGRQKREREKELKEIAAKLPEIQTNLGEIKNRLNELRNPRERAESLRREAEQEATWRERSETTRQSLAEKEQAHAVFAEKLTAFAALDTDLQTARATRERTNENYQKFLANRALAESLTMRENELAAAAAETARLEKEFQAAADEHDAAARDYNHERHLIEKAALLDAQRREAETAANLNAARRRETELTNEIKRLEAIRKQMQAEFAEKYKLERVGETTEFIRDTLKKAAPEVAKSYLFSISKEANEIFREVAGTAEQSLRWTEEYEIVLEEGGHDRPFISLSGGEQMAAALSVRLALLKQLSDVRVAFFDEPTTNLDLERRERLAQQIGQIRNFDQLFVISHDDTFEENVDFHVHVDGAANAAETPE